MHRKQWHTRRLPTNRFQHGCLACFALVGGRLYCTAMAAMILQVYYRNLPIYREASSTEAFPQ
jgi:hypothetical protein